VLSDAAFQADTDKLLGLDGELGIQRELKSCSKPASVDFRVWTTGTTT
jgi:selenophosphate synthetase-related protein